MSLFDDPIPSADRRVPGTDDAICHACYERYCAGCSSVLHKPHRPQCPGQPPHARQTLPETP